MIKDDHSEQLDVQTEAKVNQSLNELWPDHLLLKRQRLKELGDSEGLRRLTFGRYVCWLRSLNHLSQEGAATTAGISRAQWNRIECGRFIPQPSNIPCIADTIGTSTAKLFKLAGYPVPPQYLKYPKRAAVEKLWEALDGATDHAEFLCRVSAIWQEYYQTKTDLHQRIVVDAAYCQLVGYAITDFTQHQRDALLRALALYMPGRPDEDVIKRLRYLDNLDRAVNRWRKKRVRRSGRAKRAAR